MRGIRIVKLTQKITHPFPILAALMVSAVMSAGAHAEPILACREVVHHFGDTRQGAIVSHVFEITNMGNESADITSAVASSKFLKASMDKMHLGPDEVGRLNIDYDTREALGFMSVTATLTSTDPINRSMKFIVNGSVSNPLTEADGEESTRI